MGKAELKIEIDADLLEQARAAGLSVEDAVEAGLRMSLDRQLVDAASDRAQRWLEENVEAIASHNRFVEENGAFGEEWRSW